MDAQQRSIGHEQSQAKHRSNKDRQWLEVPIIYFK